LIGLCLLSSNLIAAEVSKYATSAETQTQRDARLQWFRDAKFGALINPLIPSLRSDHPLIQRPSPQKQIPSSQGWIQSRLGETVSIAAWSAACGLNADYFSRLFKAHTGMPPKTWLIEARLQRATRLLADPDATVEKVAGLCGFDCPYHFSRTFKRRFGIPPASYRRVRHIRGFVDP
jgi:transcriptional regulator GlxA family with amidase domain